MSDFAAQGLFIVGIGVVILIASLWVINSVTKQLKDHLDKMNDLPF